jgi:hypothetical protein
MNKENVVYIHSGVLLSTRNEVMLLPGKWTELDIIKL